MGVRSINNVVDVTNYVMLEIGQPLHAFDYHLLQASEKARPTVVVRRATEGEKFMTLDGKKRTLSSEMLLIADETKPVALAGVMGGQNSEINLNTVDVLIESAYFNPRTFARPPKNWSCAPNPPTASNEELISVSANGLAAARRSSF